MFDGEAFGAQVVEAVRGFLAAETEALRAEITALKAEVAELRGREAAAPTDAGPTEADIQRMVAEAVAALPAPLDGKDADPVSDEQIAAAVRQFLEANPPKGGEPGKDADPETILRMVAEAVAALPPAQPGKDVDMAEVARLVEAEVAKIPAPQNGKDVEPSVVAGMVYEAVQSAVAALPAAKDGVGLAGAMIDRDGNLVLTLTDGTLRELGRVVGKDGEDGDPGAPGFALEDFTASLADDGRTVSLAFARGEIKRAFELPLPVVIDRGVYKEATEYERGDGVTWAGSFWIAQTKTSAKPGEGSSDWRLAVKKGRDGRNLGGAA